jgi:hypothetical protein
MFLVHPTLRDDDITKTVAVLGAVIQCATGSGEA